MIFGVFNTIRWLFPAYGVFVLDFFFDVLDNLKNVHRLLHKDNNFINTTSSMGSW